MKSLACVVSAVVLTSAAGCGGKLGAPSYTKVTGTVTFEGKPLDKGTITFSCDGRPPTILDVNDGKFTGDAIAGTNRVSVSAKRKVSGAAAAKLPPDIVARLKAGQGGGTGPDQLEEAIPADWGAASKQTRTVESGGANKFDFIIGGPTAAKK